ncbi:DUF1570 domain-containing protein [Engelhardtia mirabilis]|uniref:DUF1570 domain-containing protein n=1 Tax=Engelhardtia mirabilis TaxID=2528011 RepID=A0A518BT06_9BACT|nr:hypothetical protein Pla133_52250 [Planctomycetes bacterium Pla133]QDV04427.1 hypothetical protein Pla86_52220 [Planctomycetes bacterium Pla86]
MLAAFPNLRLSLIPTGLFLAPLAIGASQVAPAEIQTPSELSAAAVLGFAPVSGVTTSEDLTADDRRRLQEAEKALEEARPTEALETAELALEYTPDSVQLLDVASRAAAALGQGDLALHYVETALGKPAAEDDEGLGDVVAGLRARLVELDPGHADIQAKLDAYGETLFELGKSAARRKLWANAVDFFQRCEDTAVEEKAEKELAKIYKNDSAVEALVASGLDIDFEDASIKKSAEAIAKIDEKNKHWEKRLEVESKGGYTIESNGGYIFTHTIARAMDQVNLFLRDMYQHKAQGQRMRGAKIQIYSSYEDFQAHENPDPGVQGWFAPWDNLIVTYSSEGSGGTLADTLNTLFHEASHQFMRDVTKNTVPAWISEGVACYFEGTELLPNGKVVANLIPEGRLDNLVTMLDMPGYVDVKDVITYFQPGSYSGTYYPWGWGLVYFMRNYEDENGVRVYRDHFDDYVATYKGGGKHDVMERWVEYFVERPAQPDVKSFDDFMVKWEAWIRDIHELHHGGAEVADRLIARGDRQLAGSFWANAAESYRWALDKRPGDPRALYGLAEANRQMDVDDVALYYYRGLLDWSLSQTDRKAKPKGFQQTVAEIAAEAMEGIKEVNEDVADGMLAANDVLAESLLGVAKDYNAKDFPRRGMSLLERTTDLVGPRAELLALHDAIKTEAQIDMRQKRRLRVDSDLDYWYTSDEKVWKADGDDIVGDRGEGVTYLTYAEMPPDEYRLEVTIDIVEMDPDAVPVIGIYFGSGLGARQMIAYSVTDGGLVQLKGSMTGPKRVGPLETVKMKDGEQFELVIEVDENGAKAYFDGKELEKLDVDAKDVKGQVGLVLQGAKAKFSGMRILY